MFLGGRIKITFKNSDGTYPLHLFLFVMYCWDKLLFSLWSRKQSPKTPRASLHLRVNSLEESFLFEIQSHENPSIDSLSRCEWKQTHLHPWNLTCNLFKEVPGKGDSFWKPIIFRFHVKSWGSISRHSFLLEKWGVNPFRSKNRYLCLFGKGPPTVKTHNPWGQRLDLFQGLS